jgi:hypothetical protein
MTLRGSSATSAGAIETEGRTIAVVVGGEPVGDLVRHAIDLARAQSRTTGIPYRQLVVFHPSEAVRREHVHAVTRGSVTPAGAEGDIVRIHTELIEVVPDDITLHLAVVPSRHEALDGLHAAIEALVGFHRRHGFKSHIVVIADDAIVRDELDALQARLQGSTLITVPA